MAISNRRLITADAKTVTFKLKDYRINGPSRYKTMTLDAHEFIRRVLIHVLPNGFHRIRHYGLLASGAKADNLVLARKLLAIARPVPKPADAVCEPPTALKPCPRCGSAMRIIEVFEAGEPAPHGCDVRRHQDRYLMNPGSLIRRCYPDLSRWPKAGHGSAHPSPRPVSPRSALDPCYPAIRAVSSPPRGAAITPPATSSAAAASTSLSKSP